MFSSSSSSSSSLSVHHNYHEFSGASSSDQLCYVHCYICDTVLAVSVPASSLFNSSVVTVRCGHCTNLFPVNIRGLLLPGPNHFHLALSPHDDNALNPLEEMPNPNYPELTMSHQPVSAAFSTAPATIGLVDHHLPRPPTFLNRPAAPEKRQRIPSAYNRFIKEEIQRIKAENPDITHREAFSAAAKNWAHFPHIHFGVMPDQSCSVKKAAPNNGRQQQQEIGNGDQDRTNSSSVMMEGFNLASPAYT